MPAMEYYRQQKDQGNPNAFGALQEFIKRKQLRYMIQLDIQDNIDILVGAETSRKSIVERYKEVLKKLPRTPPTPPPPTPPPSTPPHTPRPRSAPSTDAIQKGHDNFNSAVNLDPYEYISDTEDRRLVQEYLDDDSIFLTHQNSPGDTVSGPSTVSSPSSDSSDSSDSSPPYYESDSSLESTFKNSRGSGSTFKNSLRSSLGSSGSSDSSAASTYADSLNESVEKAPDIATVVAAQGIIEKVRQYILKKIKRINEAVAQMARMKARKKAGEKNKKKKPWRLRL